MFHLHSRDDMVNPLTIAENHGWVAQIDHGAEWRKWGKQSWSIVDGFSPRQTLLVRQARGLEWPSARSVARKTSINRCISAYCFCLVCSSTSTKNCHWAPNSVFFPLRQATGRAVAGGKQHRSFAKRRVMSDARHGIEALTQVSPNCKDIWICPRTVYP